MAQNEGNRDAAAEAGSAVFPYPSALFGQGTVPPLQIRFGWRKGKFEIAENTVAFHGSPKDWFLARFSVVVDSACWTHFFFLAYQGTT